MAVTGIGLSRSPSGAGGEDTIRIYPGSVTDSIYVKFHTDYLENIEYVNLAISWCAVARGDVPGGEGYSDWEASDVDPSINGLRAWYFKRFDASECEHSDMDEFGPGVWWAVDMDFTSEDWTTVDYRNIVQRLCGGDWGFDARLYDAIMLCVKVRVEYSQDGTEGTISAPLAQRDDLYIGYIPDYHAQTAKITRAGLELAYTSPDWVRSTDRWRTGGIYLDGRILVEAGSWAQVDGYGKIVVPASSFLFSPMTGELSGTVDFNAVWRPDGLQFASMSLDGVTAQDTRTANTPGMSAVANQDDGTVTVSVWDTGDRGVPISEVDVSLVGGELSGDRVTLAPGDSHVFATPPLGVPTTWEAVGWSGDSCSDVARATADALGARAGRVLLEPMSGTGAAVEAIYDYELSWDGSPDVETVKLDGRERPSAFYGEGGTATVTIGCTICTEDGHGMTAQEERPFRELPFAGPAMLRGPDGSRVLLCVTSVSVGKMDAPWLRSVSMTCSEVS